jgi:hypothetical protein
LLLSGKAGYVAVKQPDGLPSRSQYRSLLAPFLCFLAFVHDPQAPRLDPSTALSDGLAERQGGLR